MLDQLGSCAGLSTPSVVPRISRTKKRKIWQEILQVSSIICSKIFVTILIRSKTKQDTSLSFFSHLFYLPLKESNCGWKNSTQPFLSNRSILLHIHQQPFPLLINTQTQHSQLTIQLKVSTGKKYDFPEENILRLYRLFVPFVFFSKGNMSDIQVK